MARDSGERSGRNRLLPLLLAVPLLAAGRPASACSCVGQSAPDESYSGAHAVFVGTVEAAVPAEAGADAQVVTIRVDRPYKRSKRGERFVLHQPADDCSPKYRTGQTGLFYVGRDQQTNGWHVGTCERGGPIELSQDDLLYLERRPAVGRKTRLSGTIRRYEDAPGTGFHFVENLAGVTVTIAGPAGILREVATDANGVYELYGLPVGLYTIRPEIPAGLEVRFPTTFGPAGPAYSRTAPTVELRRKSCAGSNFVVSTLAGTVSGRLEAADGALTDICLELLPVEAWPYFYAAGCAHPDGSYSIEHVPPGRFLLVVKRVRASAGGESRTTYYPGVFERGEAQVLTIGPGERKQGVDLRLPRP